MAARHVFVAVFVATAITVPACKRATDDGTSGSAGGVDAGGFDKSALPFVITLEPSRDSQLHPALEQMSALDFAIRPCLVLPILP